MQCIESQLGLGTKELSMDVNLFNEEARHPEDAIALPKSMRGGRTLRRRRRKNRSTSNFCDDDGLLIELCRWLKHPLIPCEQSLKQQKMSTKHLRAANFAGTGRGLMTLRSMSAGEDIVCIPRAFLIDSCDVVKNTVICKSLQETQLKFTSIEILAIFLLYHKNLSQSYWSPYVMSLPRQFYSMSGCEEASCYPTYVAAELIAQLKLVNTAGDKILKVFQGIKQMTPSNKEIKWAYMAVNSRTVYLQMKEKCDFLDPEDNGNCALAPFLDLLNHSFDANVSVKLDGIDQCYKIITHVPFRKYDQVFINYGPHDNVKLFVEYGFFIPNNPHDGVPVSIQDIMSAIVTLVSNNRGSGDSHPPDYWTNYLAEVSVTLKENSSNMFLTNEGPSWSSELVTSSLVAAVLQTKTSGNHTPLSKCSVYSVEVESQEHYPVVQKIIHYIIDDAIRSHTSSLQRLRQWQPRTRHLEIGSALVQETLTLLNECKANYSSLP